MADSVRVALCDDHSIMRTGLHHILDAVGWIKVVGEAETVAQAVELASAEEPDVFIMDLSLPGESGITAIGQILGVSPRTRVLVLSMHDDVAYLREAFSAGAAGYVIKRAADVELVMAIQTVVAGKQYVHPDMGVALLSDSALSLGRRAGGPSLTAREIEVLRLVGLGYTNPEIAGTLHVSVRTVENHRANIQQKLGVRSRAQLVQHARDLGLLT